MANYLIKTTEVYRCDTEAEAKELIEAAKKHPLYTVTKTTSENRSLKQKGEIVDEWRRVTITKTFAEEKDPYGEIFISYDNTRGEKIKLYED